MNQQNDENMHTEVENKRSSFLSTLCILTFIGSGVATIANFLFALNYSTIVNLVENYGQATSSILPSPNHYYVNAFFAILSLTGAILMWGYRKIGFYIYIFAQILISIFPILILGANGVSTFAIIISGLFIFLYALNFKELRH